MFNISNLVQKAQQFIEPTLNIATGPATTTDRRPSKANLFRHQFRLPDVGEGLTEAEVVTWHVAVGDEVEVNDVLVDIETAKDTFTTYADWPIQGTTPTPIGKTTMHSVIACQRMRVIVRESSSTSLVIAITLSG